MALLQVFKEDKLDSISHYIDQLAPEGIKNRKLEDVCLSITAGGDLPQNFIKGQKKPTYEHPYPIFSNGSQDNGLYGYSDEFRIGNDAITISARGTIGFHKVRKSKFTPIVRLITLIPNPNIINIDFLNYVLDETNIISSGGGVQQLTVPTVKSIFVPIPPLPIQLVIVNILDKFTHLEAELDAELEARRVQYEYYRNELFKFDENKVGWKTLGEIGEFKRGNGLQKKDFSEDGIGCIHYGQIYTFYGVYANKTKSYVPANLAKKLTNVRKGNLVIATTSENMEDVCKTVAWLGEEEIVTGGHAVVFRHNENAKYLSYFFQTDAFSAQKKKYARGTKVIEISSNNLAKIKVPVPNITEQFKIASLLDKFDALLNNLSIGLPAEIAARRKQYEYYRGKLLDFKPSVEN